MFCQHAPLPASLQSEVDSAHRSELATAAAAALTPPPAPIDLPALIGRAGVAGRNKGRQPVDAVLVPDALLRFETVAALSGLSTRTVRRLQLAGELGDLIRVGPKCTRLRARNVMAWLTSQGSEVQHKRDGARG